MRNVTNALMAACAALALTASEASAYSGWGFFDRPIAAPPQQQVDPRAMQPQRPRSMKEKARKYIVDQAKPEKLPPGPLQIVVSIKKQHLTVYAGSQPVAHSPVSTGVPGHPTPQGIFSVIQKAIYHESNLYSSAPMPYMQRITWSGVAMHQGVVPGVPASHGCIRLPPAFAKRLWAMTKVGARVIVAQDDIAVTEIASPRLSAMVGSPAKLSEVIVPAQKIRVANADTMSDAPLKGSIDANHTAAAESKPAEPKRETSATDESKIESAIDRMVQAGAAEAEAYLAGEEKTGSVPEKSQLAVSGKDPVLRPGPISVFISRKTGKLYVRKGFDEVFETPVTIAQPERPLGTHVFTAIASTDDAGMRWSVASLPTDRVVKPGKYLMTTTARGEKLRKELTAPVHEAVAPGNPADALERITIPDTALTRITELMSPGASLIVSDLPQSFETGKGTDFIVLTR